MSFTRGDFSPTPRELGSSFTLFPEGHAGDLGAVSDSSTFWNHWLFILGRVLNSGEIWRVPCSLAVGFSGSVMAVFALSFLVFEDEIGGLVCCVALVVLI